MHLWCDLISCSLLAFRTSQQCCKVLVWFCKWLMIRVHIQAVLALQWLSKMHAACWGASSSGIWPKVVFRLPTCCITSDLPSAAPCSHRSLPASWGHRQDRAGGWGGMGCLAGVWGVCLQDRVGSLPCSTRGRGRERVWRLHRLCQAPCMSQKESQKGVRSCHMA